MQQLQTQATERSGARWTPQEDADLASQYLAGLLLEDISSSMRRSIGGIRARLVKHCFEINGIDVKTSPYSGTGAYSGWGEADDSLLEARYVQGDSLEKYAAMLGRTESAVAFRLIELRLVAPGDLERINYVHVKKRQAAKDLVVRWSDYDLQRLKIGFIAGLTLSDLSKLCLRSEVSCLVALYASGEIASTDLDIARYSARQKKQQ